MTSKIVSMSLQQSPEHRSQNYTIAEGSFEAVEAFSRLLLTLSGPSSKTPELSHHDVAEEAGRFRVWAANMGALQMPSSATSLDSRLHDAPQVREQVQRILNRLLQTIRRGKAKVPFYHYSAYTTKRHLSPPGRR